MKLTTGLSVSLAVLVTGFYTWGISTDPDGLRGLIRERERPVEGAVPLSAVEIARNIPAETEETLTYASIAKDAVQAIIFKSAPPDTASLDESFQMYLVAMKSAVSERDLEEVLSRSAKNIIVSIGQTEGDKGLEELLLSGEADKIWKELHAVLSLPFAKAADGSYCAPWFTCLAMPEEAGIVEPFETVFVIGDNVPVHAKPSENSERMMMLSHDAVRLAGEVTNKNWLKIALPADRTGYIARDRVRMMFDTHADFEALPSGLWAMTSFVIGE